VFRVGAETPIFSASSGQKKRIKKGAYDKNGGITHDTAVFALALKIY